MVIFSPYVSDLSAAVDVCNRFSIPKFCRCLLYVQCSTATKERFTLHTGPQEDLKFRGGGQDAIQALDSKVFGRQRFFFYSYQNLGEGAVGQSPPCPLGTTALDVMGLCTSVMQMLQISDKICVRFQKTFVENILILHLLHTFLFFSF